MSVLTLYTHVHAGSCFKQGADTGAGGRSDQWSRLDACVVLTLYTHMHAGSQFKQGADTGAGGRSDQWSRIDRASSQGGSGPEKRATGMDCLLPPNRVTACSMQHPEARL